MRIAKARKCNPRNVLGKRLLVSRRCRVRRAQRRETQRFERSRLADVEESKTISTGWVAIDELIVR